MEPIPAMAVSEFVDRLDRPFTAVELYRRGLAEMPTVLCALRDLHDFGVIEVVTRRAPAATVWRRVLTD